ncbi:hypothetical protein LXM56_15805 [Lysinibacillus fusiformis]|uniref:sacsin N-terminal ATP-binding-like domain-containing protein n=1 Tax=Lysinibacillus fusiformis TaxID=28031 RepID=UPI001E42A9EE|nr:hypothetical protein [Lysinibacillus fusiformis]MCE4045579.1 hypothetical protein [Lysinibacillus fusiformis]
MSEKLAIYQKKTIEAAINTIMTKMDDLRGANENEKNMTRRRWIWELMQNAKDCSDGSHISILISNDENHLVFSHNGAIFTYDNLIDLVTQISSKRTSEDKTGKFGTGFISTHLISDIVIIKGLYHRIKDTTEIKEMEFIVDRSGKNEQELKNSITLAIEELERIDDEQDRGQSFQKDFNTSFIYNLNEDEEVRKAIVKGYEDLNNCIAYVLAFTEVINRVECDGITYEIANETELIENCLKIIDIVKIDETNLDNPKIQKILICYDKSNDVSIAAPLIYENDNYCACPIESLPKLFCQFPLIGTEIFSFPIILNSSKLKVLQERNHIQEGAEENRKIIDIAISLYEKMLSYASEENWNNLYNYCYINTSSNSALQKDVYKRIQAIYRRENIVEVMKDSSLTTKESLIKNDSKNISIPSINNSDLLNEFWELMNKMITLPLPTKETNKFWLEVSPNNKLTIEMIYENLFKEKNISDLSQRLKDEDEVFSWLNEFYRMWSNSKDELDFISNGLLPNQYDDFIEIKKLKIDKNIDETLKDVLTLLGNNIRNKLVHKEIKILEGLDMDSYDNELVANKINDFVRKQLSNESSNTTKRSAKVQNTFNKLTDWFFINPDLAKSLFKDVYDNQHLLSSREVTIRRLELASSVESVMSENKMELEQLTTFLRESGRLLRLFENGEVSLTEDMKELFQHISSKSLYAKERLDYLIERSITNVHKELSENPLYSVKKSLDEWINERYSRTVFKAIKANRDIRIIIRPSDDDKIIFYEEEEIEALDDTDYELWTDNENTVVRMITLGDLIRTTGISVIRLRNLFK